MSDKIFEALLTHTCTIKRRTKGSVDEWGSKTETLTEVSSFVSCLIQASYEILEFDVRGQKQTANFMGYFKAGENIEVDDIVEFDGTSYAVVGVENAGGQGHHLEVPMKTLDNKDT